MPAEFEAEHEREKKGQKIHAISFFFSAPLGESFFKIRIKFQVEAG